MRRLLLSFATRTIAARLTLALVLFALPLAFVASQLIANQQREIAFSKLELTGTVYLAPALEVHARMVDAAAALAQGDSTERRHERALRDLEALHRSMPHPLAVDGALLSLREASERLRAMTVYDPVAIREILASGRELVTAVGEQSNLILDPELHTFYLMETAVLRTAPLLEQMGYFASATMIADPAILHQAKVVARNEGKLTTLAADYLRAFGAAVSHDQDGNDIGENRARLMTVDSEIRRLSSKAQRETIQDDALIARGAVLSASIAANAELRHDLGLRLVALQRAQAELLAGGAVLFGLALVMVLGVARGGVVTPLSELTTAMRRVAKGELDVDPPYTRRRDEIGAMARALEVFQENAVARIQAEHAARAKSDFLAVMSHEIRTPMNGVLGMAQALASTELDDRQRRMLNVVRESGETLLTLLNDILDMSKIEAGKLDLESIPFEPVGLATSARDLFDQRASQKGLLLVHEIDPSADGWRLGDPGRLRQIVFNLVSNAIKFTATGTVTIAISVEDGWLKVAVRDTGIGIPEDRRARLFAKFTQVDSSHTRLYGGTGLGLSISKAIADQMGGTLTVDSVPGEGSTFTLRVPAEIADAPPLEFHRAPPAPPTFATGDGSDETLGPSLRILVAEDNPANRFVLQTLLEPLGLVPDFAENGALAVEAWQSQAYDIILMDMQMPVMDGPAAMRAIRSAEAATGRARTPIVALTANAMAHQIAEQQAAGADGHAAKPIDLGALFAAMQHAMDRCAAVPVTESAVRAAS